MRTCAVRPCPPRRPSRKTSLALRWSHQNRDRFPDGQLYVDLNGYAPEPPLMPERALGRFLAALGVPRAELTSDVGDAAALYRSLVSSRRMLIVLDNATDPSQVRPLLPGPGGCAVIVTSQPCRARARGVRTGGE
jgi:hypothetical protein